MTQAAAARCSVIIVSRHRPQHLTRCLAGIAQLDHPDFEVIVVADAAGLAATGDLPVKRVAFDQANISAARNAGLQVAAGAVVAFIDDDAVPEPTWLSRLCAPFSDPAVAAAAGFVRGRNGLSFQWKARTADALGHSAPLAVDETATTLHRGQPGRAIRTEGTNCAFRRDVLARMGGFDPAFRFFLDETDVNLRLAATGQITAIVPGAQVHHGFAPSVIRASDRAPRDLHEIGASTAVFWRKHAAPGMDLSLAERALIASERARLIRHMVSGGLEPREVPQILRSLQDGLPDGRVRPLNTLPPLPGPAAPFLRFPATARPGRVIAGRIWQARALRRAAAHAAAEGAIVTLILLEPSARPHRMRFDPAGYWEQRGGIWGPADRQEPRLRMIGFGARIRQETARIAALRPVQAKPA
ncbi:glycosyltransferase family 2 protein [Phaeovulum sp. NW3]|uniref:glycosyltransferase family 2 protein n=1 Tax=Phaeovulum sp. NW3 TaxID=2934933 RepID=UPI00201FE284|nr:glycosyltransferase family 2 protein [Phaeovulum sp. NW3]MCL7465434.1 glycosyltransferase family 2 protein [Phaeovulum sp. NW3]